MSRLANLIFQQPLDLAYEDIDVSEWGVKLRVQEPDADRRADLAQQFVDAAGTDGEMANIKIRALYPALLIATVVDPEDGTPVFTEDDAPRLGTREGRVVDRLANVAMRVSGLAEEDGGIDAGKDGSSGTPNDAASTG